MMLLSEQYWRAKRLVIVKLPKRNTTKSLKCQKLVSFKILTKENRMVWSTSKSVVPLIRC